MGAMVRLVLPLLLTACAHAARPPVIDVHLHLSPHDEQLTGRIPNPITGAPLLATDEASLRAGLTRALDEAGVVRAVVSGEPDAIARWKAAAPGRIIAACAPEDWAQIDLAALRRAHAAQLCDVLAEVQPQYDGLAPDDPRLEPLWALAEELDLPVGFHLHPGPPDGVAKGMDKLRLRHGNPLLLEDVLTRHRKLRLYVMHAGWPFLEEMIALLYAYERVSVDIGVIDWTQAPGLIDPERRGEPPREFYTYLKRLVDAGFGKRILFGSDAMVWPEAVPLAVKNVLAADFLTDAQKRDILHDNAMRFLRLPPLP